MAVLNSAERAALWFSSKLANTAMLTSLAATLSLGMESFLVCFVDLDTITLWGLLLLNCFVMKLQKLRKRIWGLKDKSLQLWEQEANASSSPAITRKSDWDFLMKGKDFSWESVMLLFYHTFSYKVEIMTAIVVVVEHLLLASVG